MARVTNDGMTGAVGNVIFYTMNGVNYARAKPGKRKKKRGQTETAQIGVFRAVSRYGTAMVKQMSSSFLFPFGRGTYNLLRGWMAKRYAEHQDVRDWPVSLISPSANLNLEAELHDFLKLDFTVTDEGRQGIAVNLPAFNPRKQLKAPAGTAEVNMKFIAVSSSFDKAVAKPGYAMQQFSFVYKSGPVPARRILLETGAKTGDIALVIMAVEYRTSKQITYGKDPRWLPAGVVAMGRVPAVR